VEFLEPLEYPEWAVDLDAAEGLRILLPAPRDGVAVFDSIVVAGSSHDMMLSFHSCA
jgi:hypothetical protein